MATNLPTTRSTQGISRLSDASSDPATLAQVVKLSGLNESQESTLFPTAILKSLSFVSTRYERLSLRYLSFVEIPF